ncbi:HAD domain-containing protein [Pseudarthrobacter sp. NS4]|uniref:HAD domain-containing protein n=1 Tax=Pseudarthrobacter sp. NS4 TaxID=2973976 RepID=UPI002163C40C|nr:HAD domain-containing protein [Pseudarthrobacter sp. NS4]
MARTLYIDVDGVICPFGPEGTTGWGTAWRHADAGLLPVAYAAELVAGLNTLARADGVRCVWLTSWEELAPQYLCPAINLDGGNWPYLSTTGTGSGNGWWKLRAIQDDVEITGADAAAWIDDQLAFEAEAQSWIQLLGRRMLAVSPHPRRGMSPDELSTVCAFLTRPLF